MIKAIAPPSGWATRCILLWALVGVGVGWGRYCRRYCRRNLGLLHKPYNVYLVDATLYFNNHSGCAMLITRPPGWTMCLHIFFLVCTVKWLVLLRLVRIVRLGPLKFSLQATMDHHGPSIDSGHYTASINCCKKNILLQRSQNYGVWNYW